MADKHDETYANFSPFASPVPNVFPTPNFSNPLVMVPFPSRPATWSALSVEALLSFFASS